MTTTPMEPHEEPREEVAAADPGRGAPPEAPGFGVEGEEPDADEPDADESAEVPERAATEGEPVEPPD